MQRKIEKIFFDLEIISFDLVALNTGFKREIILVIACPNVEKQSHDFRYYEKIFFGAGFVSE